MVAKDRTQEFFQFAEALQQQQQPGFSKPISRPKKSAFSLTASHLGRSIHDISGKLNKLSKLAKKKSIFDDPAAEIQELTVVIKQDIQQTQKDIEALTRMSQQNRTNRQADASSEHIVNSLRGKLGDVTKEFSEVLTLRTENMKEQQDRRSNFTAKMKGPKRKKDHPLHRRHQQPQGDNHMDDMEGGQMQQLLPKQDSYLSSRAEAVESIESTIVELGGMFSQIAHMVAEQAHLTERIDQNVDDSLMNVDGAQEQLLKYFKNLQGNRWLMIKIFFILLFFIIFFLVFMT